MRVTITGGNLPGARFCDPDGSARENVHVGVQIGREPAKLVQFEMFRRAKLMLDRIEPELLAAAMAADGLAATVDLTGGDGGPRCARVDPPAITWSVPEG